MADVSKEKELLNDIKAMVISRCRRAFGFCGVADAGDKVILNAGETLKITIEIIKD